MPDPESLSEATLAHTGAVLFDRSAQGLLEASGGEAVVFLHNLTTNDIKNLAVDAGCEAFLCNQTARVLAWLHVFRDAPEGKRDRLWLDLPPGLAGPVFAHLDKYLISEDVELTDRSGELGRLHLAGPEAPAVLQRVLGAEALPGELLHQVRAGEAVVRRVEPLGLPGYDVVVRREQLGEMRSRLLECGARPAGERAWEVLRVEAGTPVYGVDITENTFAPEVGRTRQAISYTKGCYLGQEPIVMARDRGQVQRTLLGLKLTGNPVPAGSLVFREDKEVGRVTSSLFSPRLGRAIALAYIKRGSQQPGTVVEVAAEGGRQTAEVSALPFSG
jgi:folate-binding protein YgfZ